MYYLDMSFAEHDIPHNNALLSIEGASANPAQIVEELGRFVVASKHIVGVVVKGWTYIDGAAFIGGHTIAHREDYATMTIQLDANEGIRHATRLLVSNDRLAQITDVYTVPEHLKEPTNHVDAFIGHFIKGMIGHAPENTDSFRKQAFDSADPLAAISDITLGQAQAFRLSGGVNVSRAQKNVLYRGKQLETMEHVLRFLIAHRHAELGPRGTVRAGIDYREGTGIMGEALAIVNGGNDFSEAPNPATNDKLYLGMLRPKSSVVMSDKIVYYSNAGVSEQIWPPENSN